LNVPVAGSQRGKVGAESSKVTSTLGAFAGFVYAPDARSVLVVQLGEVIENRISLAFELPVPGLRKSVPSIFQKSTSTLTHCILNPVYTLHVVTVIIFPV